MKHLLFIFILLFPISVIAQGVEASKIRKINFAQLGTPISGQVRYIRDGTAGSPCTGGGTGAYAYANGTSWICTTQAPPAATTPGGSTTQVQYNNAGAFGGISGATTNGTKLILVGPDLGTPASGTATNLTGLPISTGLTGAGTGVLTALGVNVGSAGAPVLFNGAGGTPSSLALANGTGLPLTTGVIGVLPVANGGTNCAVASITCVNNISGGSLSGAVVGTTDSQALTNKTINGNTFTAGTYTLTGAAAKVFTFNNTLTLSGTDGSTLNVGTGGTLGTNAYTSTGYMPLAGGTFTGDVTHSGAAIIISGNISGGGIFGTSGIRIKGTPGTLTDTTSSGTVATSYTDVLGGNTITASSATTVTNWFSMYVNAATAGSNVTLTNKWAIGADSLKIGTSNPFSVSAAGIVTIGGQVTSTAPITVSGSYFSAVSDSSSGYLYAGGSRIANPGSGTFLFTNPTQNGFGRFEFGGTTNSYAGLGFDAVNGLTLQSAAGTATWNDASTAGSGTVANRYLFGIAAPTLTATNSSVTNTVASTFYIGGAPTDSTNTTSTTKLALNVAAGETRLGGGVLLGSATAPSANNTAVIAFQDNVSKPTLAGTLPTAFYNKGGEQYVQDSAGNETLLSPHNFSLIPGGASESMAWSFWSERDGQVINVDMLHVVRLLEKLTGEKLIYIGRAK